MRSFIGFFLFFVFIVIAVGAAWQFRTNMNNKKTTPVDNEVTSVPQMTITSSVFSANGPIPTKYSCKEFNANPPLHIVGVPAEARSVAVVLDDRDAPNGSFIHWLVYNVGPLTQDIDENSLPYGAALGFNSNGRAEFYGPCPPSNVHHYAFRVFAIDQVLPVTDMDATAFYNKIHGHIVGYGELVGWVRGGG